MAASPFAIQRLRGDFILAITTLCAKRSVPIYPKIPIKNPFAL